MNIDVRKVLPKDPSSFNGHWAIRIASGLLLLLTIVRSCIHLFSSDGGANSIAGVDISVEGGENIVAIFHQWGAIQLILAVLLSVLFVRYPGFLPLILLTLALDPIMRFISGQIKPLITDGPPPGESLNWPAFFLVFLLFIGSLFEKNQQKFK